MLHIFNKTGVRTHCLPAHSRCKHHTVCTHPHQRDEHPIMGRDHHCLHAPDGRHIGFAQPTHAIDCACTEEDCRHLRAFIEKNADKGLRIR